MTGDRFPSAYRAQYVTTNIYAFEEVAKIPNGPNCWFVRFIDFDRTELAAFAVRMFGLDSDTEHFLMDRAREVASAAGTRRQTDIYAWLLNAYRRAEGEVENWHLVREPSE